MKKAKNRPVWKRLNCKVEVVTINFKDQEKHFDIGELVFDATTITARRLDTLYPGYTSAVLRLIPNREL